MLSNMMEYLLIIGVPYPLYRCIGSKLIDITIYSGFNVSEKPTNPILTWSNIDK